MSRQLSKIISTSTLSFGLILGLTSCGTNPANATNSGAQKPVKTQTPNASPDTSSTLALYPNNSSFSKTCSAYYLIAADIYLLGEISKLPAVQISAAQTNYDAAVGYLENTLKNHAAELSTTDAKALEIKLASSSTNNLTSLNIALANLKLNYGQLCQAARPIDATVDTMISVAESQGMSSACVSSATTLQSSADLSYAVVVANGSSTSATPCYANQADGILERLSGSNAAPVETFVLFPCGQAPPAVLLSLFGTRALDVCYPKT